MFILPFYPFGQLDDLIQIDDTNKPNKSRFKAVMNSKRGAIKPRKRKSLTQKLKGNNWRARKNVKH